MNSFDEVVQNEPVIGYAPLPHLSQEEYDNALYDFLSIYLRHNERFTREANKGEVIYYIHRDGEEIGRFRLGRYFGSPHLSLAMHWVAHERATENYGHSLERWPDVVRTSADRMAILCRETLRTLYKQANLADPEGLQTYRFRAILVHPKRREKLPTYGHFHAFMDFLAQADTRGLAVHVNPRAFQIITFSPVMAGIFGYLPPKTIAESSDADDKQEVAVSTPEETFAWGVLAEGIKFLFNQLGEFLKERREKRKSRAAAKATSSTPLPESSTETDSQPIASEDALLEVLKRKSDLATREMEVRRVDALLREITKQTDTIDRLREKRAGMLSPTQQVEVEQQIDERQQQLIQSSKDLLTMLERLSGETIRVEALEDE